MMCNIFIAEDSGPFISWLEEELSEIPGINIAGSSAYMNDALTGIIETQAEIVIVDMVLIDSLGINLIRKLREENVNAKMIVFTAYPTALFKKHSLALGADHFLSKVSEAHDLIPLIKQICAKAHA